MNRRQFLEKSSQIALASSLLPAIVLPKQAQAQSTNEDFWEKPRTIFLQRKDSFESQVVTYWQNGKIDKAGYLKTCEILRDGHQQKIYPMDIRLLDLIRATQAWVFAYGYNLPFIVHSAYRTKQTNNRTEGAVKNSKHLVGQAIDFSVPNLPVHYLGLLAQRFIESDGKGGGVGFYYQHNFVHMDTGRGLERVWAR